MLLKINERLFTVMLAYKKKLETLFFFINKYSFWISLAILALSILPVLILQENAYVRILDCLDPDVIYRVILSRDYNYLKGPTEIISSFMNGIPRGCFPSSLNVLQMLFLFCKPIHAFLINVLIVHIAAFFGMFLLLKKHVIKEQGYVLNIFICSISALCFSLLPFDYMFGLSLAGQPLLFYAFLNILNKHATFKDYFIIFIFPFYSYLVLVGVFCCMALFAIFLVHWWNTSEINLNFFGILIWFGLVYLVVEYQLIYMLIFEKNYVSHRQEFNFVLLSYKDFRYYLREIYNNLLLGGRGDAASLHHNIVRDILPIAIIVCYEKNLKQKLFYGLIIVIFFIALLSCFFNINSILLLRQKCFFLNAFDWSRIYFLLPMLWYILFAMSLALILNIKRFGAYIVWFLALMQLHFIVANNFDLRHNFKIFYNTYLTREGSDREVDYLSFKEFYSEGLFSQIAAYINEPKDEFKIVNIGILPSAAQYNGFYTLDGYIPNYPLEYKHKFRKIMEIELNKNSGNKLYFDYWANRCYLFCSELTNSVISQSKDELKNFEPIKNLQLDTEQLKNLGCKYIFSAVEILNYKNNSLKFIRLFTDKDSPYKIFLYQT